MKKENQAIQPEGRLSVLKTARKRQDAHKSGLASDDPDPCKVEGDTQSPAVPFPSQLLKIVEWICAAIDRLFVPNGLRLTDSVLIGK